MKPTDQQIEEIAEHLDAGMKCYYHFTKGEIKYLIPKKHCTDEVIRNRDIKEIEVKAEDYVELEPMSAQEQFRLMADFAERVEHHHLQERLINALNQAKPMESFMREMKRSKKYFPEWIHFKKAFYIDWINEQIKGKNQ